MAAFSDTKRSLVLTGGCAPGASECEPVRLQSAAVTSSLLPLLGIAPALGRTFTTMEDRQGGDSRVVVIGHDLWARRFGSDPGLVGRDVTLDDRRYTVVGIMPDSFAFPNPAELWVPLVLDTAVRILGRAFETEDRHEDADGTNQDTPRQFCDVHPPEVGLTWAR